METDTQPQPINTQHQQPQLEVKTAEPEDPWFDDASEEEEKEEEETEEKEKVTISVGEAKIEEKALELSKLEEYAGESRYNEYYGYDHHVDYNYLVLLIVLNAHHMVNLKEISGLEQGYIEMYSNTRKIIVKTTSEAAAGKAIARLSDFVDKLSVLKLELKGNLASRCSNFRKLKQHLRKDGIVLFATRGKDTRELFIGGTMKLSELRAYQQHIKSIRVQQFSLRALRNTRSYKLVVEEMLSMPNIQQELMAFNYIKFAEVDQFNRFKELKVILGATSKKQLGTYDYEELFMKQLRRHCVIAFCYPTGEKYLQKPKVEGISFRFITDREVKKSYMYIMGLKEDIVAKQEEIRAEVAKINNIIGVRLFYHLFPGLYHFSFNKEHYYLFKYPQNKPYSVSVSARTREGHTFNWKDFLSRLVEVCSGKQEKVLIQ